MFEGKKILYVHGYASSAQSGTVKRLRALLPQTTVVARDLPVHPAQAIQMLRQLCRDEQPSLIVGTSMGGMFAEQLYGYDRILVNPAFQIADTMQQHGLMGKVSFLNPREDGATEFYCDKALQAEYRQTASHCFEQATADEDARVAALFGTNDTLVDTFSLFRQHYTRAIRFSGGHRLDDHALRHALLPLMRRFDRQQTGQQPPVVYAAIEHTLQLGNAPAPSAQKAFRLLAEQYDAYIVADCPTNNPQRQADLLRWAADCFGVDAYDRVVFTNQRHLLYGDYLIDARPTQFIGTLLHFGQPPLKTWDNVIEYFQQIKKQ